MNPVSEHSRPVYRLALIAVTLVLSGCVSFSPDGGFGAVQEVAKNRLGKEVAWVKTASERESVETRVAGLLKNVLTVEDAVQIALLNNRGLQASFFELGISEADLVQAGRFPNPHFSMLRASRLEDGTREYKIEQAFSNTRHRSSAAKLTAKIGGSGDIAFHPPPEVQRTSGPQVF